MKNYREAVQRIIAIHHARLEMGLSKTREDEPFVLQMSQRLNRNKLAHSITLTEYFDTVFVLPEKIMKDDYLLKTIFSDCDITRDNNAYIVSLDDKQIRLIKENEHGF